MKDDIKIRLALPKDSETLLKIYEPYVKDTVISFEYEVPSLLEFRNRITGILENYPWLVCEINGEIVGYAYASEHRKRAAYQWSADFSVYIQADYHRKNIGKALYTCLIELLRLQGYYNGFAGITMPNDQSENFHKAMGFKPLGVYENVGYKFGSWHDVKWLQLKINEHSQSPEAPKSIKEIKEREEFGRIIAKGLKLIKDI